MAAKGKVTTVHEKSGDANTKMAMMSKADRKKALTKTPPKEETDD